MSGCRIGLLKVALAATVAISHIPIAAAQTQAPELLERVSQITVTPAVADIGIAREINVSGHWNGCAPVGVSLGGYFLFIPTTRIVRMILPQTFAPCPLGMAYSQSTSYTPVERGKTRILVLNADGEYLGETQVDTRAANDHRPAFNITGMWYDPQSNGSGLTFVHSRSNDNAVFGTWYVYDAAGKPRWYTIQNAEWKGQGRVMEGLLYETAGVARCPLPFNNGCPASIGSLTNIGRARVTLTGDNSARVEALTAEGVLVFSSNVIRAAI